MAVIVGAPILSHIRPRLDDHPRRRHLPAAALLVVVVWVVEEEDIIGGARPWPVSAPCLTCRKRP
jgi:hypothetical protein